MSCILERPDLNKIFLLYGNLDDMFMSPDLQRNNFRPFLNAYLRSLGYECIVFYSGAKNTGKYVLDDKSAVIAINKNKSQAQNSSQPSPPQKKRRILTPRASQDTPPENSPAPKPQASQASQPPAKLIYKQPKITPAEFLDDAKKMMADSKIKTAIIFTFFQDFVTDSSAPLQQYSELLSHLWDEYALNSNENICIFLAPQMDGESLSKLFEHLNGGEIFQNRFFNADKSLNTGCTVKIGLPAQDEFQYMLEYLRLVGVNGKKINFNRSSMQKIISLLMFFSREADRKRNRDGYLSSIFENIARYLRQQEENLIDFNEDTVKKIYGRFSSDGSDDPLETLVKTPGWEGVAKRIQEIVRDFKIKKAAYEKNLSGGSKPSFKKILANERIDSPGDTSGFNYPVPSFILKGHPGVGKTTVARLIGRIFYEAGILKRGMTIEATREDLVDRYVGGTANRTRAKIIEAQESVLFVDDAYSLIDKSDDNNYPREAIDEIVAAMTNTKQYRFCMIMAGYPEPMDELLKMNAGLSSRFSQANILTIEDYKPEILKNIFISNCKKDGYKFSEELDLDLFFKNMYDQRDRANFGNARDVVSVAREAKMQASLRDDSERLIIKKDFGSYSKFFESHGVNSIEEIYRELDEKYIGLDFVKELFDNVRLEILDAEDCKRRGVQPDVYPDHYIFAGNPGTGKTTVGKLLGNFYHLMGVLGGAETIFVDASELIGTHVGESKNKITEKIQEAIDHNSLLYIDEAYQIADTAYSSEIVGAMMTRMTENAADFKMIFGMYSNRVEDFLKLNAGLARRVRIINFPDYTPSQLLAIFDKTIEAQGRTITPEAHEAVAKILEERYDNRDENFGNAGEVKKLVIDMKRSLLKRTAHAENDSEKYIYTVEDLKAVS